MTKIRKIEGKSTSIIIVMGVSASGKTTIGRLLAERLKVPFYDADDFHPKANVEKMSQGIPLNDADRFPWLEKLSEKLQKWSNTSGAILACSALKENYRKILSQGLDTLTLVYLSGTFECIKSRIAARQSHFMKADLLQSQFDTLEIPSYGIHVNIAASPETIVQEIMEQLSSEKSQFGLIGLGVMGKSISLNALDNGISTSVYNRAEGAEATVVDDFLATNNEYKKLQGFTDLSAFVQSLASPRKILMMVKAGRVVDSVLEQLLPLLSENDIVIDGGNSHYEDTRRRFESSQQKGIHFVGAGVSGGEEGARRGPSIMPGGARESYTHVANILESIAAKDASGRACCTYIGKDGAGHFIKMVHNGIEYAEMQLLAECYALLKDRMSYEEIAATFEAWNQGELSSYLLEITIHILQKKEGEKYLLDLILDKAGNKGTGSWSSKAAMDLGVPNTMMSAAVFARYMSAFKVQRVVLAQQINGNVSQTMLNINALKAAYQFARLINHHQGFELMRQASESYNWELNLSEIARIWTNGCIIKSTLMQSLVGVFQQKTSLIEDAEIQNQLQASEIVLAQILQTAINARVPVPCLSAAHNYWIAMTSVYLPANLIQAQRDYFGAHTYQRTDAPETQFFHTNWSS